ncbi:MAG: zinc ribbon domain-containing protein [Saccharofermentans sp.]|nr:zinc ribbon domain-containing protein [Saccharofermentans sp.]
MGNGLNEFNELRRMVRTGASIMNSIEQDEKRRKMEELRNSTAQLEEDKRRMQENESAYQRGLKANKSGSERFELKEMTCPNCGAQMKPNEVAMATSALGSVDCPYCGSKIVLNDEVKNAEYVHKVEVEQKRTQIEDRKLKLEEERLKAQREFENNKNTIDTINSIDQGITKAMHFGRIAIGCFTVGAVFFVLLIMLIIFLFNR